MMPFTNESGSRSAGSRSANTRRPYAVVRANSNRWDLLRRERERCAAADQPFLAVYRSSGRDWVGLDLRTMRTSVSEISFAKVRTAFECSDVGARAWPGPGLFLCHVRNAKEAHRLARYVTGIIRPAR